MLFYIIAGFLVLVAVVFVNAVVNNFRSVAGGLDTGDANADGRSLTGCPETPNCVSSYPESGYADLSPWEYGDRSRGEARTALIAVLNELPRTEIKKVEDDYVHAVHRSRIFRFRDDLEFHLPADTGRIDFRAASRLGRGDLGVHEKRMRRLGEVFADRVQPS
ncbi:MAG: DUF1499 domain-containing protein [Spirochaetales bacterium]